MTAATGTVLLTGAAGGVGGFLRAGHRAALVLLVGIVGPVVLGAVFVFVPSAVADHDLAGARAAPQDRLSAVNDVRTTLLQVVGGLVVLFARAATCAGAASAPPRRPSR